MASIRILKKDINILTYDLLTECYVYKHYDDKLTDSRFDEVIKKISTCEMTSFSGQTILKLTLKVKT